MDKKQVGRPKLYDSSSDKVGAFRKRLESAGFMRKEVLVTKETWDLVTNLATEYGASVSDAASGLLEHGARAFAAKSASSQIAYSRKQVVSASPEVAPKPKSKPGANPIENFFLKRKESTKSSSDEDPV